MSPNYALRCTFIRPGCALYGAIIALRRSCLSGLPPASSASMGFLACLMGAGDGGTAALLAEFFFDKLAFRRATQRDFCACASCFRVVAVSNFFRDLEAPAKVCGLLSLVFVLLSRLACSLEAEADFPRRTALDGNAGADSVGEASNSMPKTSASRSEAIVFFPVPFRAATGLPAWAISSK